jgi:hypothetical protein
LPVAFVQVSWQLTGAVAAWADPAWPALAWLAGRQQRGETRH